MAGHRADVTVGDRVHVMVGNPAKLIAANRAGCRAGLVACRRAVQLAGMYDSLESWIRPHAKAYARVG
jgi:hypothetical protein